MVVWEKVNSGADGTFRKLEGRNTTSMPASIVYDVLLEESPSTTTTTTTALRGSGWGAGASNIKWMEGLVVDDGQGGEPVALLPDDDVARVVADVVVVVVAVTQDEESLHMGPTMRIHYSVPYRLA